MPETASGDRGLDSEATPPQIRANPRLLVVDDVADNRTVLARRFQRRDFEIVEAAGGIEALELIESGSYDAVLLDVMMPDLSGLEVLRRIRLSRSQESLPVIMVTANSQSADIVEALELGANDYVVQARRLRGRARARERAGRAQARERGARDGQRSADAVERSAQKRDRRPTALRSADAISGSSRRSYRARQSSSLPRGIAARTWRKASAGKSLAILFVDLDSFSGVNDAYGHSVGDALLKSLAIRMLDSLGNSVCIARLGGDKFAVLQMSSKQQPEAAMSLADQLLELIAAPCRIEAYDLMVSASIGIAVAGSELPGHRFADQVRGFGKVSRQGGRSRRLSGLRSRDGCDRPGTAAPQDGDAPRNGEWYFRTALSADRFNPDGGGHRLRGADALEP